MGYWIGHWDLILNDFLTNGWAVIHENATQSSYGYKSQSQFFSFIGFTGTAKLQFSCVKLIFWSLLLSNLYYRPVIYPATVPIFTCIYEIVSFCTNSSYETLTAFTVIMQKLADKVVYTRNIVQQRLNSEKFQALQSYQISIFEVLEMHKRRKAQSKQMKKEQNLTCSE